MKTLTKLLLLAAILILNFTFQISNCWAQAPAIQWEQSYGGTTNDRAAFIQQTSDGGYIVAGTSNSTNGNVTGHHGDSTTADCWVLKLDSNSNIQWEKSYGGSGDDIAECIEQTMEGGYIMAAITNSNDGDVSGNHGNDDYWLVKLDAEGNILWQKCYGGSDNDDATSIEQTTDSGYILGGYAASNDGDVTGHHSFNIGEGGDYWLLKLDVNGNLEWENCYGGSGDDDAYSTHQTADGGYIMAGWSDSQDGDVTGQHDTVESGIIYQDYWVVKVNSIGTLQWEHCYGSWDSDDAYSIEQTSDKGYIVAGLSGVSNGDVTGTHGSDDYWVVKIDSTGKIQWEKALGGTLEDVPYSVIQTNDGGYAVAGSSLSDDDDVTGNHGNFDYWVVKLDTSGNLQWEESLGGSDMDGAHCIEQTKDGGFIIAGGSQSNDGNVTGNQGGSDFWIVKLFPDISTGMNKLSVINNQLTFYPNPANDEITITGDISPKTLYTITDITGRRILSGNLNNETNIVNIASLTAGVYLLQTRNEYRQTFKIVKE